MAETEECRCGRGDVQTEAVHFGIGDRECKTRNTGTDEGVERTKIVERRANLDA